MRYAAVTAGEFLDRPNRFIARVRVAGAVETVHVKNTGRCRELLIPGRRVYLADSANPFRKTRFDLIAVEKPRPGREPLLINMDSQLPNAAAEEFLRSGKLFPGVTALRREVTFGDSRLDFYLEHAGRKVFLEVKGVTLETDGVAMFPDAPTARGVKHLHELTAAVAQGYDAVLLLVIQMRGVTVFRPNDAMDPEFGAALRAATAAGVRIAAVDCLVTPDAVELDSPVPADLSPSVPQTRGGKDHA